MKAAVSNRYRHHEPVRNCSAFTLVELLTVIAIIAVLASLLLTALTSARKKSRATVCTFNLHQICLAVDMYVDDLGKRPTVDALKEGKYVGSLGSFLCPEDKTGNWGQLVRSAGAPVNLFPTGPVAISDTAQVVKYSYLLDPLDWDETAWKRLMRLGGVAGIAVCQLHGLGSQDVPDVHRYSGLLLRGQRDGAVVRRHVFWPSQVSDLTPRSGGEANPSGLIFNASSSDTGSVITLQARDPYPLFIDDPGAWSRD